ncbi:MULTISPECIES: hypothetical protein [Marinovum]|uniref:hypothetical protein n=1 Tax=Marinovum TaxID=367771 RepID=UPI00237B6611|nr:hypothetical protein [Marinovum sp. PR37]MDD9746442.1 hypothetical protein [Marinovum sp. PR37]
MFYTPFCVVEPGFYCGCSHALFAREPGSLSLEEIATYPMAVRPYLQKAELAGLPDAVAMASVSGWSGRPDSISLTPPDPHALVQDFMSVLTNELT